MSTVPNELAAGNPFQRTSQWLNDRTGCLTASRMAAALDKLKNGQPSWKCESLIRDILAERMTGDAARGYVTPEMQRGIDLEPEARAAYEAHTGNLVDLVGFIKHPEIEWFGASPDGLVDDDGLVEFKCPKTSTHVQYMLNGTVPSEYEPQMLVQMACTGRRWCDFVSYDDRVRERSKRLLVVRFEPHEDRITLIEEQAREFLQVIDNLWERLHS